MGTVFQEAGAACAEALREKTEQGNSGVLFYNVREKYHSLGVFYTLLSQLRLLATL